MSFPLPKTPQLEAAIDAIDLSMPMMKIMDVEEGQGWSKEKTEVVVRDYRRFLLLASTSATPIVPTKDIDKMWHQHILDTVAYAKDCQRVFGAFLHHFPYYGLRGEEDAKNLKDSFEQTKSIWLNTFGEDISSRPKAFCGNNCQSGCVNQSCTQITIAALNRRFLLI